MPSGGGECRTPRVGGWQCQAGRNARLLSAWPRWGGKQAGPGQPLPLWQGVDDAGGWVPRTQNKPVFYFQVLLWTLSKVPGEREGRWGEEKAAQGKTAGRGVGVDGGLTGQRGRALVRTPPLRLWVPAGLPEASISSPSGAPLAAKPPTFKLPSPLLVRIIITKKDNKGIGCLKPCCQAVPGTPPPLARYWEEAGYHPTG